MTSCWNDRNGIVWIIQVRMRGNKKTIQKHVMFLASNHPSHFTCTRYCLTLIWSDSPSRRDYKTHETSSQCAIIGLIRFLFIAILTGADMLAVGGNVVSSCHDHFLTSNLQFPKGYHHPEGLRYYVNNKSVTSRGDSRLLVSQKFYPDSTKLHNCQ